MADRKQLQPLAVFGNVVVVDAKPLLAPKPAPLSKVPPRPLRRPELQPIKQHPPKLLTRPELFDVVRKVPGIDHKKLDPLGPADIDTDLRLSPRQPWVEGRGHLEFYGARMVSTEADCASFIYDAPDVGVAELWLTGIVEPASYLAQIRVGGFAGGHFHIRGSDTGPEIQVAIASEVTIVALLQDLDYSMSLIRVEASNTNLWLFWDVTFTAI